MEMIINKLFKLTAWALAIFGAIIVIAFIYLLITTYLEPDDRYLIYTGYGK